MLFGVGSCAKREAPGERTSEAGAAAHGPLVARVGKVELHEDDLTRMQARDPGASGGRFSDPSARPQLIDGLVRFELLVQAAERAGLTKDPDAIHALEQIAVTKLVNRTLGSAGSPEAITDADVAAEYAARQATEFTLPPAAQVRHIRVADAKLAARLASQGRALAPDDDQGFAKLATKTSEDAATRAQGGNLGFIDKNSKLPPLIVKAALELRTPGEVSETFATDAGYEILRLVSIRASVVSPLSSVEQQIRQRLYRERRSKALEDFIAKLRHETTVQIVDGATHQ